MGIKEVIEDRVPARIKKFPNYRLFLVWASETDAKDVFGLRKRLEDEIGQHERWLHVNGRASLLGHKNRLLRAYAKYLDFLRSIKKEFFPYL